MYDLMRTLLRKGLQFCSLVRKLVCPHFSESVHIVFYVNMDILQAGCAHPQMRQGTHNHPAGPFSEQTWCGYPKHLSGTLSTHCGYHKYAVDTCKHTTCTFQTRWGYPAYSLRVPPNTLEHPLNTLQVVHIHAPSTLQTRTDTHCRFHAFILTNTLRASGKYAVGSLQTHCWYSSNTFWVPPNTLHISSTHVKNILPTHFGTFPKDWGYLQTRCWDSPDTMSTALSNIPWLPSNTLWVPKHVPDIPQIGCA